MEVKSITEQKSLLATLSPGKRARLRRLLFDYGPGNGPLILKINGKTDVPPSDEALSTTNASVEDAVRLGADAVGYTMYMGSPRQGEDLHQLKGVREDCERYGMPLIVWAYPRGRDIEKKGGQNSFYAIDYAVRMAMEMGA